MSLLVHILVIIFVTSQILELGECSRKQVNFRLNKGKYLANHVIETRQAETELECGMHCVSHGSCVSVNYQTSGIGKGLCELNNEALEENADHDESVGNPDFSHLYIIKTEYNASCFPAEKTHASCKDVFEQNSSAPSGVYILQLNDTSETYKAYCHMPTITECGGGAWTLVMKLDGDKETFKYNSSLWTTNATLNVEEGLAGWTENETKLASYHYTSFTKICLVLKMDNKHDNKTSSVLINHTARSLYSVIADGNYTATYFLHAAEFMTKIKGEPVQQNCTRQGFNLKFDDEELNLRIGFTANIEPNCTTPDTVVGFGIGKKNSSWSNGLVENSTQYSEAFTYILVH